MAAKKASKKTAKATKKTAKKAEKKKKSTPLEYVKGIGASTAGTLIAAGIKSAEELEKADPEKLAELEGIGEATAKKFIENAKHAEIPVRKRRNDAPDIEVREHALVPNHEVMTDEEVAEFFEGRDIQPTNLPTIYITDPALKGLEAKMGDIIKITRKSRTAQQSTFYRRVAYE